MSGWANGFLLLATTALSGFGGSWLTARRSAKTDAAKVVIDEGALELDERRADGEAYERAQQINQQIIGSLTEEVARLDKIIQGLRSDLAESQQQRAELETRVRELEDSAANMRRLLKDAGVDYPPAVPEKG